ncbi:hypothetical protein [Hyphobacterium sp.]|uniref:hypothetical protein n=1 Tax=Hyphobacterium sp. TaxID=2004662 RepID=UPI003B523F02
MFKKLLAASGFVLTLGLSACQTTGGPTTLACRAPTSEEFDIFRAVVSRDHQTLVRYSAAGAARAALERRDPYVNNHFWGNQGYTGGTVVGVLTQPPPCVVDLPPRRDANGNAISTQRAIAVYQENRFRALVGGTSTTIAADQALRLPGNSGFDYFRCEFSQTSQGWRMTDLCGLPTVRGGIGQ